MNRTRKVKFKENTLIQRGNLHPLHRICTSSWKRGLITLFALLLLFPTSLFCEDFKEYEVKAAYIFNLMRYVDWPTPKDKKEKEAAQKKGFTVGVIGKDPFGKSWNLIKNKTIDKQKITVIEIDSFKTYKDKKQLENLAKVLSQCHVLFISSSEKLYINDIIGMAKENPTLTISETDNFLEHGGIVNFLIVKNKIRFEINLDSAKIAKLKIKTTVLKLAQRVVQKNK